MLALETDSLATMKLWERELCSDFDKYLDLRLRIWPYLSLFSFRMLYILFFYWHFKIASFIDFFPYQIPSFIFPIIISSTSFFSIINNNVDSVVQIPPYSNSTPSFISYIPHIYPFPKITNGLYLWLDDEVNKVSSPLRIRYAYEGSSLFLKMTVFFL